MLLVKQSSYNPMDKNPANYISGADLDLTDIFQAFHGRVRFGNGNNGSSGENIAGQWAVFTTNGTANTEFKVTHNMGAIPIGYLVVNKNKAGDLYTGTTKWDNNNAYLKCSVASVTMTIFLLQ